VLLNNQPGRSLLVLLNNQPGRSLLVLLNNQPGRSPLGTWRIVRTSEKCSGAAPPRAGGGASGATPRARSASSPRPTHSPRLSPTCGGNDASLLMMESNENSIEDFNAVSLSAPRSCAAQRAPHRTAPQALFRRGPRSQRRRRGSLRSPPSLRLPLPVSLLYTRPRSLVFLRSRGGAGRGGAGCPHPPPPPSY
jgi:hypothetical protein